MRNGNVAIGMFVVTGLALFTLVLFTIGNQHSFFPATSMSIRNSRILTA